MGGTAVTERGTAQDINTELTKAEHENMESVVGASRIPAVPPCNQSREAW